MSDSKKRDIDRDLALLDPSRVFGAPEDVVHYEGLSHEERIDILRRWSYDAAELAVAEEEGMGGGEPSLTDRILECLRELDAEVSETTGGLTKHGSVPARPGR